MKSLLFNTRARWIALAVFGAVFVVACRGGGGGSSSGTGNPPPAPTTYSVGGTVSGLSGTLVLQNNAGNDLTLSANGPFSFATALTSGASYAVTVLSQPGTAALTQNCAVSGGTGTIASANLTSVAVACTTTMINGLAVPPDPGAANDLTLAGIDADTSGIRDDIDIFIATKYGANVTATKAARTSARARQRVLTVDEADIIAVRVALQDSSDAGVCAGIDFRSAALSSAQELQEIYLRTYNTPERLTKQKSVSAAAGQFTRSVTDVVCP